MIITSKEGLAPQEKPIWMQCNEICPPPPKRLFNKEYGKHIKVRMSRLHSLPVRPEQVCNKRQLAKTVRDNYGFGDFYVMFRVPWVRFKTYNPYFVCVGPHREYAFGLGMAHKGCQYYGRGKCRKWDRTPYTPGMTCKKNRKHGGNWQVRAHVTIKPRYSDESMLTDEMIFDQDSDFTFVWHRRKNKMQKFKFWEQDRTAERLQRRAYREEGWG